ncbi:NAD(P)/FAD-dependent oxidoreductase [Streptomonospora sp. PA3]|uniref:NAD(P)/FAD-dependent oxidoreductase n=1 Tax=Streptomonospora sp. PA3 TaxID=2607326 RepID=UPI0012DF0236|nr:NAD(P)/FAD-dependent oxidoreductase [Streptomonospora sp. PA3]MUL41485.1 NAD(P)/FAD-dependent oxidoreductase [Streptomonospora sp. PA3]
MIGPDRSVDVIVIGGGPAGSTTAAFLAEAGFSVVVLEREKFPRYHIGESLIPGCLPVVRDLGLWDRLADSQPTKKYGATLLWGEEDSTWGFRFADGTAFEYSYQVRRADFDSLLMTRARELGAQVIEEAVVKRVEFDGERATGVSFTRKGNDEVERLHSAMVVDASGQGRIMSRQLDLVEWHEDLRNIAVWNYYQGCDLLEGDKAGDVLIEHRPEGWFWFIPLNDGTVSIGYVTSTKAMKESGRSPEELFESERRSSQEVLRLMTKAEPVGAFRTARDWSYTSRRFHGPGWVLVGDAGAFVDPLFSTGVTLAMRGARSCSKAVEVALRNPEAQAEVLDVYEARYREFLRAVLDFVRFFYKTDKTREDYWAEAQDIIDPDKVQAPHEDFSTLLSGLADLISADFSLDIKLEEALGS